ncbi:MAG: indole-3-glycerol-phosphate synthase TrpC, partial [Dehalococcoidia bacterium]
MRQASGLPDILQRIVAAKREQLRQVHQTVPLDRLKEIALRVPPGRSLVTAIRSADRRPCLIAEAKMASPSAGRLMDDKARSRLPLLYAENGASAISVLTERDHVH